MEFCCVSTGLILALIYITFQWMSKRSGIPRKMPYSEPGIFYPLKIVIFYCMMRLRKLQSYKNDAGYGAASHCNEADMERPQCTSSSVKAIDAVFFSGSSASGWGVVFAMERRPKRLSSVLVYIKVPDGTVLVPAQHPDAINFREESDESVFRAGGLFIEVIEATKIWRISYHGKLRPVSDINGVERDVEVDIVWQSSLPIFNYDSDLDLWSMAKAFAREPWSRKFFENLRQHHQTHYEQMGNLRGRITIDGRRTLVDLPAFRDHSYGQKRDWKLMHRYYFHHVFLSDGSKGVLGLVCQPSTCTRLVLGHWWSPAGEGAAISDIDLELKEHGEGGTPPKDYAFSFKAGKTRREVKVNFRQPCNHYLGWDWEAKFYEVFVNYEVDGIPGTGICEWEYRNHGRRPEELSAKDPDWAKRLREEYLTT